MSSTSQQQVDNYQMQAQMMGLPTWADLRMLGLAFAIGMACYEMVKSFAEDKMLRLGVASTVFFGAYLLARREKRIEDAKRR